MATIKESFAAASALTCTLASLGNASAQRAAVVDNSANLYDEAMVAVTIKTNTTAISATGYVSVYAYASADDGTTYETGGSSNAGYTLRGDEKLIGTIAAIATSTTYTGVFSVAKAYGGVLPRNWGIIVDNETGNSLTAVGGDHSVKFQGVTYTVA